MKSVPRTAIRVLTFQVSRDELLALDKRHLAFGLLCTWIVGMGRYWDNPRANFLQHLGVGSVVYVFVLAAFLWIVIAPLRPRDWSYFRVLTFLTLTSPPAIIYAFPVQNWTDLDHANSVNVSFLGVVAVWRVGMLIFFLRRLASFDWIRITVGTLTPLCGIVVALTLLNLEQAVFDAMGGIVERRTPNDAAYEVLFGLTMFSMICIIPLLIAYLMVAAMSPSASGKPISEEDGHQLGKS
jgi:hypothetical protein